MRCEAFVDEIWNFSIPSAKRDSKLNGQSCGYTVYISEKETFVTFPIHQNTALSLKQHRAKTALRTLPRIRLHLFRHFCPKLLKIRQYSCVVLDNLTKKLTARLHDNLCAVLP